MNEHLKSWTDGDGTRIIEAQGTLTNKGPASICALTFDMVCVYSMEAGLQVEMVVVVFDVFEADGEVCCLSSFCRTVSMRRPTCGPSGSLLWMRRASRSLSVKVSESVYARSTNDGGSDRHHPG